jgi:hypothetical protein
LIPIVSPSLPLCSLATIEPESEGRKKKKEGKKTKGGGFFRDLSPE